MELPFEKKKRAVLVRKIAETSDKFGKYPEKRTVEELFNLGIVNIDKPAGPTSHQVSAYVKDILSLKKAGHSGTLDPNVTGVLPVALGKATKIVQTLLKAGKEYVCVMHVHKQVPEYELYKVFEKFTGMISQLPPVKSSVKRQWRERTIYYIDVLEIKDQDVLFAVGCQAGTYIRKLCSDIGKELGTGAHMAELRRTKAGPFSESTLFTLQDLTDAFYYYKKGKDKFIRKALQPIENAVSHLPKIWVLDTTVDTLCHGASLAVPGISKLETGIEKGQMVAVFTLKDELVCYGEAVMTSKEMMGKKGLAVKIDKVVMEAGVYPRITK
ncbi:RNA-guided pseudouridylation complex pseudouridine synthase subunit Cbf5 [Candidatus Woesearchaeota archaeon]|nr:RNA-guided pseudouridylation complex pseudouridine synthase subunit Cbf5 [Candidatus Woesearchaeota archaeon]